MPLDKRVTSLVVLSACALAVWWLKRHRPSAVVVSRAWRDPGPGPGGDDVPWVDVV